jgi:hypothetical protein
LGPNSSWPAVCVDGLKIGAIVSIASFLIRAVPSSFCQRREVYRNNLHNKSQF